MRHWKWTALILTLAFFAAFVRVGCGQEKLVIKIKYDKPDPHFTVAQIAYVGSAVFDLGSTWHKTSQPGFREGNPVLGQDKWRQGLIIGGVTAFTLWGARHIHKQGHRKLAKGLLWAATALHTGAAAYNLRLERKY